MQVVWYMQMSPYNTLWLTNLAQVRDNRTRQFLTELLPYFWFPSLLSSSVSRWLCKSFTAIFDRIIIIVINDYEYYCAMSIHLSHHAHQDKNKIWDGGETRRNLPAKRTRLKRSSVAFFQFCAKPKILPVHLGFTWWFLNNCLYSGKLKACLPQKER